MIIITDSEFKRLVEHMYKNYGITLEKKRVLIQGRLNSVIREKGLSSFTEYLDMVFRDISGKEVATLINKLTTNHTYFMREPEHFEFLKKTVLPEFEKSTSKQISIWSAGCSSGEEPYTIAMLLDDYFGTKKMLWNTKIFASDISMNVLDKAKEGIYSLEKVQTLPKHWVTKYFKKIDDDNYKIVDKIRNEVEFQTFNLMKPISLGKQFDIVFCRNVMIYFDQVTKTALANRFYGVTKQNGYLFIGHAESLQRDEVRYKYIRPAVYRKV